MQTFPAEWLWATPSKPDSSSTAHLASPRPQGHFHVGTGLCPPLRVMGQVEGNTSVNILEVVARLRRRAVIELSAEASVSRVNTPPRPNQTQHRRKGTDGRDDTDEGRETAVSTTCTWGSSRCTSRKHTWPMGTSTAGTLAAGAGRMAAAITSECVRAD